MTATDATFLLPVAASLTWLGIIEMGASALYLQSASLKMWTRFTALALVRVNNVAVRIEWVTLLREFVDSIGPLIHAHLPRERAPALPIKFSLPIWGSSRKCWPIVTAPHWGWAFIRPTLKIEFVPPKNVFISLCKMVSLISCASMPY